VKNCLFILFFHLFLSKKDEKIGNFSRKLGQDGGLRFGSRAINFSHQITPNRVIVRKNFSPEWSQNAPPPLKPKPKSKPKIKPKLKPKLKRNQA
jgi:hypothetical protein